MNYTKEELSKINCDYLWNPFTQMSEYCNEDIFIVERAKGAYIWDIDGNKYLDGVSSIWLNIHGHNKKELNDALKKQVDLVAHTTLLGQTNIPATLLAKELVKITPKSLQKVFYSDDGATSVEIALKIAFQYFYQIGKKEKNKFLSLKRGYHGDTIGSVSVGGVDQFHSIFAPMLFDSFKANAPYCYRCPFGKSKDSCNFECVGEVEEIIKNHKDELAAFILEPEVIAAGGMITLPRGYLSRVAKLCKENDILLIVDEVAVGFGRTGKMFACEHEGVEPDIMCLSKGITGGYMPFAATLVTNEIYEAFLGEEDKKFTHGHSYTGNQLGASLALANLEIFKNEDTINKMQPKIEHLKNRLQEFWNLKNVGDIRQSGFMVGIELVKNKDTKEPFDNSLRIGHQVTLAAREEGLILRPIVDIIEIVPMLNLSIEEIDFICNKTYIAIEKVMRDIGEYKE